MVTIAISSNIGCDTFSGYCRIITTTTGGGLRSLKTPVQECRRLIPLVPGIPAKIQKPIYSNF